MRNKSLGRHKPSWEDNYNIDFKVIGTEVIDEVAT